MIREAAKANLAYAIGSTANSAALFILTPYLVNALIADDYGAWILFEVAIMLLSGILLGGLDVGLMRSYWFRKDEKERARLAGTALIAAVMWGGLIIGVLGIVLIAKDWNWLFPGPPYAVQLALSIALIESIFALLLTVLRIRGRAVAFVTLNVGRVLGFLGSSIGMVQAGAGLAGVLAGRLLAGILGICAAIVVVWRYFDLKMDWRGLRRMAVYGLPLLPTNVAFYILLASDRYFLEHFYALDVVAVYSFAYKVGAILDVFLTRPFALDWAPRRFKVATRADAQSRYADALVLYLYAGSFLGLLILGAAPAIYSWVAPAPYRAGMRVVPLILAAYLIYGLSYPLNVGIMLRDQTHYLPIIGWLSAGICVVLNLWLIPVQGMLGAALATLISYTIWTCLIALMSLRLYRIAYPIGSILWIMSATILGYIGISVVGGWAKSMGLLLGSIVGVLWISLIYLGVGYGLWGRSLLPRSLIGNIAGRMRK